MTDDPQRPSSPDPAADPTAAIPPAAAARPPAPAAEADATMVQPSAAQPSGPGWQPGPGSGWNEAQPSSGGPSAPPQGTQSGAPYGAPPGDPYGAQPGASYGTQPGTSYGTQPGTSYGTQPGTSYGAQPGTSYGAQPGNSYGGQPGDPYGAQPGASYGAAPGNDPYGPQPGGYAGAQAGPAYGSPPPDAYPGFPNAGAPGYPPSGSGGTSGFAIASLIFGILGGILLSVIFGIVALVQIRKRGQTGRGMAIAGLVLSGCWVLLIIIGVVAALLSDSGSDSPTGAAGNGTVAVTELKPGDCINGIASGSNIEDLPVIPCTISHEGEVYAVFELPAGPWPGDTAVQQQADKRCETELKLYAPKAGESVEILYLHPLQESWSRDRKVTCVATDESGTSTGSVRD